MGPNTVKALVCMLGLFVVLAFPCAGTAYAKKGAPTPPPYAGYSAPGENLAPPDDGGYTGPGLPPTTVEKALSLDDDAWVALKGSITNSLGGHDYMFSDASGSIQIKIGQKAWRGQTVGSGDVVELRGKVKKGWTRTKIDVKQVVKQ